MNCVDSASNGSSEDIKVFDAESSDQIENCSSTTTSSLRSLDKKTLHQSNVSLIVNMNYLHFVPTRPERPSRHVACTKTCF